MLHARCHLVDMLSKLVTEVARPAFLDHILIETTGLANPAPIIQTFYLEPDLAGYPLDGRPPWMPSTSMMHLDEEKPEGVVNEALEQVAFASDRLVMNKTGPRDGGAAQVNRVTEDNQQPCHRPARWCRAVDPTSCWHEVVRTWNADDEPEPEHEHEHEHSHLHSHPHSEEAEDPACATTHTRTAPHGDASAEAECDVCGEHGHSHSHHGA